MLDRTINQLEIQGPFRVWRPLTAPLEIQTTLDVSQKGFQDIAVLLNS